MKKNFGTIKNLEGFSLAEVLAALTIAAMVLAAVLGIYSRAERSAAAVTRKLDSSLLPSEIMQRIAEDLDRIIASGSDTKITIENKFEKGLPTARLTIRKSITSSKNQEQLFEEIVWQTSFDYDSGTNSLVLYRSHSGMTLEDKLLDEKRQDWEKTYSFVPICTGITFFKIQVPQGEKFLDKWTSPSLPAGITVTISFAEPFETVRGTLDVPEAEKITRTIAIDRTRKINFKIPPSQEQQEEKQQAELVAAKQASQKKEEQKSKNSDEKQRRK
ncbi:MAG: type II secretion system protein J [Sedimentisphaerales bacterium]